MKTLREKNVVAPGKKELLWGILCWVMFAGGFHVILSLIFDLDSDQGVYWFQIAYFACCFLLVGGLFFRFLISSFKNIRGNAKDMLFAVAGGFAAYFVLTLFSEFGAAGLLHSTGNDYFNPNQDAVEAILGYQLVPMAICSVLLVPVTEEVLVRGMVFAPICRKWPWLAYIASTLLFAGMHTLAYVGEMTFIQGLTNFLLYIPAGLVMGWMYQKTRNIWGPIILHMLINLVAIFG